MKAQNSSLAQELPNYDDAAIRQQGVAISTAHDRAPAARSTTGSASRRREGRPASRDGANPFGPDVILPEQFYDQRNGLEQAAGEKALMLAVLEDGIRCFQEHLKNPRVRPRLLARQA